MEDAVMRLTNDEDGYRAAWDRELAELHKMTITGDGAI